jgi:hypothetical protein
VKGHGEDFGTSRVCSSEQTTTSRCSEVILADGFELVKRCRSRRLWFDESAFGRYCRCCGADRLSRPALSQRPGGGGHKGAAGIHQQLVKGDLASECEDNIRAWLGKSENRSSTV